MRPPRRRLFCIALLLYQALWLNVVVPGHTRGAVSLPGTAACPDCAGPRGPRSARPPSFGPAGACRVRGRGPSERSNPSEPGGPGIPTDRAAHCAICYFAAVLMVPPALDLTPLPLGLLRRLPPPPPTAPSSARPLPAYYGRGPPAAAATPC